MTYTNQVESHGSAALRTSPPSDYPEGHGGGSDARRPWSLIAIVAFVASLLGFLGVTAIVGLLMGILGIVRTAGGQRRGLGLAIAAIPVSCITGLIFLGMGAVIFAGIALSKAGEQAARILRADAAGALAVVQSVGSEELRAAINEQKMGQWLAAVRERHGTFSGLVPDSIDPQETDSDTIQTVNFGARFTKGQVPMGISFSLQFDGWYRLEDLSIDGLSLRRPASAVESRAETTTPPQPTPGTAPTGSPDTRD